MEIFRDLVIGSRFLLSGFNILLKPRYLKYIIVPILINFILLVAIFFTAFVYLKEWFYHFTDWMPKYLLWLFSWLIWAFYIGFSLFVSTSLFCVFANLLGAPFYGLLAEKILIEKDCNIQSNNWPQLINNTIKREGYKIAYFTPYSLLALALFLLPLIPQLIFAWLLAIQYIDYAPDNLGQSFYNVKKLLKQHFYLVIGFGLTVSLAILVPGLNLIVPPAAVCGGTLLYLYINPNLSRKIEPYFITEL